VVKPHGLKGEVVVERWSDVPGRLDPGAVLVAEGRPLAVLASRPHAGRVIVAFEGVVDREGAEALRRCVLRAAPVELTGDLWVDQLMGVEVLDTTGRVLGTVEAVEANPASDLLVLSGGTLVPLRFVVEHQPGRRVTVEVPEGLVD